MPDWFKTAALLALVIIGFSVVGRGDYVTALEIERDQLRQALTRTQQEAAYDKARCPRLIAQNEVMK